MGLGLPERVRRIGAGVLGATALASLAACSQESRAEWENVAIPEGAADHSEPIITLWQWSWLAAMIVGVLVWGLIIFVMIKYRRRSDDEIPVQTRYNLPMEILYTVAPVVVVLVLFKFIIDTQNEIDDGDPDPDHVIEVVGQQWSWTFNYVDDPALGGQADRDACGEEGQQTCVFFTGTPADFPTLVLPVGESVRFELSSPDVIHSFWVPAFTYKLDIIPGRDNDFTMTPTRTGTFAGKCAELCGTYHSRMLFNVEVVEPAEYAAYLEDLREDGNLGLAVGGSETQTQDGLQGEQEGEGGTTEGGQQDDTGDVQ